MFVCEFKNLEISMFDHQKREREREKTCQSPSSHSDSHDISGNLEELFLAFIGLFGHFAESFWQYRDSSA